MEDNTPSEIDRHFEVEIVSENPRITSFIAEILAKALSDPSIDEEITRIIQEPSVDGAQGGIPSDPL